MEIKPVDSLWSPMLYEHLSTVEGKGLKMTPSWYSFLPADFL